VEEVRLVPIPPQLVVILREHLATFGAAEDRRLFTNEPREWSARPRTTACGRRLGRWRSRRLRSSHRSLPGRTTSDTRRCRRGSTPEWIRPKWPNVRATVLRCC
jgi:hypothetical protein